MKRFGGVPRFLCSTGLLAGLLAPAPSAQAAPATAPDAGALQQQIERDLQRPMPALPAAPTPSAPAPAAAPSGVTVTVSRFVFRGNTRLSDAQLQAVVAPYLNRPLSFNELQNVAAAVAEAYRAQGFVVRVFLPQQELKNGGDVTVQIVEARFGDVRLQPQKPDEKLHVNEERLRAMVLAAQPAGEPVRNSAIDRALLLIDDLPGINAGGALAAGQNEGETDLALRLANEPWWRGDVRADNTGSRSTGRNRLTGDVTLASPSRVGDAVSATLLHTTGSDYGRLGYRRPVGYAGWTAGLNASYMQYELIGSFATFRSQGSATTVGLEASYPLLRGRLANLSLQIAPEHKHYNNEAAGVTTTRYDIDNFAISFNGNRSDRVFGGGAFSGNLLLVYGNVDLAGSPNKAADALTTRTAGGFSKLSYALNRQQQLGNWLTLNTALSGQFASKNLDSAEKFYIGGAGGVRAYPSSDGGGSEGTLLKMELQARAPWHLSPSVFYDWGRVHVNVDNDFPGAGLPNGYALQGAGLALAYAHPKGVTARVTWARRIGSNPNPDPQGNDQDGSLVRNRFWLEAGYAF